MGIKVPGINTSWRKALVLDPHYQMGFKHSPTEAIAEQIIPRESDLHPHKKLLERQDLDWDEEVERRRRQEAYDKMAENFYERYHGDNSYKAGGRVRKNIDGIAKTGKTKGRIV